MTISEQERAMWHGAAARATEIRTEQLTNAYGLDADDDLRRAFRWIAANASDGVQRALISAFDNLSTDQFREGYRDGLDSADLTEDERKAHENDLGFDEDDEDDDTEGDQS